MKDVICSCCHWVEEHPMNLMCAAPNCECMGFTFDPEQNTPQSIADRGGIHSGDCECSLCKAVP